LCAFCILRAKFSFASNRERGRTRCSHISDCRLDPWKRTGDCHLSGPDERAV
jgi:hypothetical protein